MPNYDFDKDTFHLCWSEGDELVYLDRESLSALSTVLSAALNADQVEMPTDVIEEMLEQIHAMDTRFAKLAIEKAKQFVDGIYLLRDPSGYEKTVEATFDNGKLVRLVDKDGNDWINWANDVVWTEQRASHQ